MSGFDIKGWCPGALRPMASGDGLVVRIRAHAGRLTPEQANGIAMAAMAHGNGLLDLSARANLQIRGVTEDSHPALIADLRPLGLIDADVAAETRRNILVTPFAETRALAAALEAALAGLEGTLPGKFGFALDTGPLRLLTHAPADIRIERGAAGGLILRADGAATGLPVTEAEGPARAVALARWFLDTGGAPEGRGRMKAHLKSGHLLPDALTGAEYPAETAPLPGPGLTPEGALIGFAMGETRAKTLSALAGMGHDLILTPWRMILIAGATRLPALPHVVTDPEDPLRRVVACTGAPRCPQALAPTRALARGLATHVPPGALLHVSGCAKGCAHPGPAPFVLTATVHGFDFARDARASDDPAIRDIGPERLADPALFTATPPQDDTTDAPYL
ncbi:precorrin-3B synthase [Frigidibacter sp. MR17.14]|uniref:precorrin-3B synthase n=1 Tax=Frigidibacter sp. MR17.14 TaxID=3126509 RepID=UPI003012E1A1